jgi:hypothetical protein
VRTRPAQRWPFSLPEKENLIRNGCASERAC